MGMVKLKVACQARARNNENDPTCCPVWADGLTAANKS
jgi:hypothetical protein